MNSKFPSIKVFLITWMVLLAYLTLDFVLDARAMFIQLSYDWENVKIRTTINPVEVDSLSHDYLALQKAPGFPKSINASHTFSLKAEGVAFFRCTSIRETNTHFIFSGVKWINGVPEKSIKSARFQVVDLPLLQSGNLTVTTIGDSQIIWREARELRKNLLHKQDVVFMGDELDVYGYPYVGGVYDKSESLLKKLFATNPTQKYILFFGAQDKATEKTLLEQNICEMFEFLQQREQTQNILAVTLPPSPSPTFNDYNIEFNKMLQRCAAGFDKVNIIDLHEYLADKKDYLQEDGVHLNRNGYGFLNKLLLKEIK